MSLQQDLSKFLEEKINRQDSDAVIRLEKDAELLTSGLISSLILLELAEWIEARTTSSIDLTTIDLMKEWNTIERIVDFIERHANETKE